MTTGPTQGEGAEPPAPDVVVVGSLNHDLGLATTRVPRPGETVLGEDARWGPGGKGANQAVGCARLGLTTAMVGMVGDDASGGLLRQVLAAEGVDTTHLGTTTTPTGLAVVLVTPDGESTIVLSPGANRRLGVAEVTDAAPLLGRARAVLCQLEIPLEAVAAALGTSGGLRVLNPAPGLLLPAELLAEVDVLVPNRHELATIVGGEVPEDLGSVTTMAREVAGPRAVVVTLGEEGALVVDEGVATHVPAVPVTAVDATAAGDGFCAGLVSALLGGADLVAATRSAVRVGAATVRAPGAMGSLPRLDEIAERLGG